MIETMANNMVADFCLLCSFADVCVLDGDEISKHRCSIEGSSILINYNFNWIFREGYKQKIRLNTKLLVVEI